MKGMKSKGMKIKGKKLTATLLIAVFILSTLAIAINVSAQEYFVVVDTELENVFLEIAPTATVALSTDEAHSGSYSVKITTVSTGADWSDWGGVEIRLDDGIALKDISTLSFWQKLSIISVADPLELDSSCVVLYIDYDGDGVFEYTDEDVMLLGANDLPDGDTTEWDEFDATTRGWWTGYPGGIGDIDYMHTTTFDTWKNEAAIKDKMVMSVVIGYCNLAQTLYIDDVELNGVIYPFEEAGDPVDVTVTGDGSISLPDADTTVTYTGAVAETITIEDLAEEDVDDAAFAATGNYIDVKLEEGTDIDELVIKVYYDDPEDIVGPEEDLIMYWYDENDWHACSDTGVIMAEDYIWAKIRADTSPSLSQMTGTVFGQGGEVNLNTTDGSVGTKVGVVGTGAIPLGRIRAYWDGLEDTDELTTDPAIVKADGTGGFAFSITVPEDVEGIHYIAVKDMESEISSILAFTIKPEIVLDPTTALAGDTITVDGTGFAKDEIITIRFDNVIMITILAEVKTNDIGSFDCKFDVPDGAADECVVKATDVSTNEDEATLTIGATITLDPAEGPSGTVVGITGIGFTNGEDVTVTFNGEPVYWEGAEVNDLLVAEGIFSGHFIVPTEVVGEYTVTAEDVSHSNIGTLDFEVTGTSVITLTPIIGAPDSDVIIEGVNFTAVEGTEVSVDFGTIYTEYVTFYTNDTGGFRETFDVPFLEVGEKTVKATDANGLEATEVYTIAIGIIILDESEGHTGTDVAVTAHGFDGTEFNVTFGDILVLMNDAPGVHTFTVPTVPVGEYTVTVEDETELMASETFTVNATTELTLTPETAPVGYVVSIVGDYFWPTSTIEVILYNTTDSWELGIDITITGDLIADADGTFEATFEVPEILALGDYLINATDPTTYPPDDEELINVLEFPFSVVEPYIDIHTVSTEYDPVDTVSFYVNSTFDYALEIDIDDSTGYPITTIYCPTTVWEKVGDYYVIPYSDASFVITSDAEIGIWNWTAYDVTTPSEPEEMANGTFTVGEPVGPEPDYPATPTNQESLDSLGSPKTDFVLGELVLAYAKVTNGGNEIRSMLVVFQWTDPQLTVLPPSYTIITDLAPGASSESAQSALLPTTGYATGTWTAEVYVLTTWIAQGGVVIGTPVYITIEVTN